MWETTDLERPTRVRHIEVLGGIEATFVGDDVAFGSGGFPLPLAGPFLPGDR